MSDCSTLIHIPEPGGALRMRVVLCSAEIMLGLDQWPVTETIEDFHSTVVFDRQCSHGISVDDEVRGHLHASICDLWTSWCSFGIP
jgi:hypothetical protein